MGNALQRTSKDITEIYDRHVDTVYRVCFMILQNVADTEDAVQTTFIKLLESDKAFNDAEHEKAWLIVTARNHCLNVKKHWWQRQKVALESVSEPSTAADVTDELREQVLEKVLALPEKYRLPIYLHYYEGYKTAEISRMLGVKEPTVRTRLHAAREKLRLEVGGEENG